MHLKEFVSVAAQQGVGLWLILAVERIHAKLILLHNQIHKLQH